MEFEVIEEPTPLVKASPPQSKKTPVRLLRKATERDMVKHLIRYYDGTTSPGNGPRYVLADHVRNRPGFDADRTADFMVVDTWQGLARHGFEIKVDRKDWLHELKQPEKSDAFKRYMDRWWLVVPDEGMVRPGELPTDWGLIALRGAAQGFTTERLVVVKQAPKLEPQPMPWTLSVPLLRAVQRTARTNWES